MNLPCTVFTFMIQIYLKIFLRVKASLEYARSKPCSLSPRADMMLNSFWCYPNKLCQTHISHSLFSTEEDYLYIFFREFCFVVDTTNFTKRTDFVNAFVSRDWSPNLTHRLAPHLASGAHMWGGTAAGVSSLFSGRDSLAVPSDYSRSCLYFIGQNACSFHTDAAIVQAQAQAADHLCQSLWGVR